jgi:hypothetical protein
MKTRIGFVVIATTSLQLLSLLAASWGETPRPHSYFVTHVYYRRRDDGSAKGACYTATCGQSPDNRSRKRWDKKMPQLGRPQRAPYGAIGTPTIPNTPTGNVNEVNDDLSHHLQWQNCLIDATMQPPRAFTWLFVASMGMRLLVRKSLTLRGLS